jgi:PAS domain S-box-containing protein
MNLGKAKNIQVDQDLEKSDPLQERAHIEGQFGVTVRSVIDVPFSHGTLAINSTEPNAFLPRDIESLQELAQVLSEGFKRLADLENLEQRNQQLQKEITARQQAEEKTTRFSRVLESSLNEIYIFDVETLRFAEVNRGARKNLGYTMEELRDLTFLDLKPEVTLESFAQLVEPLRTGNQEKIEFTTIHRRKDGTQYPVEVHLQLLTDGFPVFAAIILDITARQQAEDATKVNLALQRVRNEVLQMDTEDSWHKVVLSFHEELKRLVEFNACSINLVDLQKNRMIAHAVTPEKGVIRNIREPVPSAVVKAMENDHYEYRRSRRDPLFMGPQETMSGVNSIIDIPFVGGTLALNSTQENAFSERDIHILEQFSQVMSEAHRRLQDITERRHMEEELSKVQKLESLGVLAGGIAHDFNNVLAGVIGNLSLLEATLDKDSDAYKIARAATQAADRTRGLTQQLLTFAKGGAPLKELVAIEALIRETIELSLHGSNTKPEYHLAQNLPWVNIDKGQIGQVLQNLVLNADQAMPEGGILKVSAESIKLADLDPHPLDAGDYVKVSVVDQGIGMSSEVMDKIFDPYYTTKPAGHGLGLSITHSIIQRHGGHITVHSKIDVGTTFELYLPALQKHATITTEQNQELMCGTGRILLMDDMEMIHRVMKKMLERLGYEMESVYDGQEVLQAYQAAVKKGAPYDAVIMDLTIPGAMGGQEAVGKLHEIDPKARVIVSSGYADDPVMTHFAEYGFAGAIKKPMDMQILAETVKGVLKQ